MLRAMNQSFGVILALNRVLESYRPASNGEESGGKDDEDDVEPVPIEEPPPAPPPAAAPPPPPQQSLPPNLAAASMLLKSAEVHTLRALLTYLGNALSHPNFRTIQLANQLFHERVWSRPGGASLLRAAGFKEATLPGNRTALVLPPDAPLQPVRAAKELVEQLLNSKTGGAHPSSQYTPSAQQAYCSPTTAALAEPAIGACAPGAAGANLHTKGVKADIARANLHKKAAESVLSIEGLLEDAHTKSWDAAINLPQTALRVESLSSREIRCCRKCNQGRLTMLIGRLTNKLWELGKEEEEALMQSATRLKYLNTLRMLTRLMPILLEDTDDAGVQHMLWTLLQTPPVQAAAEIAADAPGQVARQLHTLGGCLLHGLLQAFFARGFTVVSEKDSGGGNGAEDSAAGSNLWSTSSATLDEARVAAMRALIACSAATLYVPADALSLRPNRFLLAAVGAPDPHGKALFRALVSVTFNYDPVGWGIPFASSVLGDSHGEVMEVAAQLLLVLLSQPDTGLTTTTTANNEALLKADQTQVGHASPPGVPQKPGLSPVDGKPLDKVSRLLAGLQRNETLDFLIEGFDRLLRSRYVSESAYLPSSVHPVQCEHELVLLLWITLSLNRKCVLAVCSHDLLPHLITSLCHLVFLWLNDLSAASAMHLCVLSLLLLSAEAEFATCLNKPCPRPISIPGPAEAVTTASGGCTIGDLLLALVGTLVLSETDTGRLRSVYPGTLALLANIAPHVKAWSAHTASYLPQMLGRLASPSMLFSDANHPEHLISLLEAITLSLQYTHQTNHHLLHVLLINAPLLRSLPQISLPPNATPVDNAAAEEEEEETFVPTAEWLSSWKAQLPLRSILATLDTLLPKVSKPADLTNRPLPEAVKAVSLAGVVGVNGPIAVRRYAPNESSRTWQTQVIWGLIYSKNQELFEARAVKLVSVVEVVE